MDLKKVLITCIAGIALLVTVMIPSVVANAYPACPKCGERVYPGQNHVCSWRASKENDEVDAEICIYCGMVPAPGRPHKCIYAK
ncbi:hypothetical protein [Clostridium amazonitimonense]|uniref:hypothetical protein n=1 Tax=Clostridium amazonitimonense TaxID=1499689 RepID=UPI0005098AF8|nr:hypothetical protein [Clostridium amazonitimonense]